MARKRKSLRVPRPGAVTEGELPKELKKIGPRWMKQNVKLKLIRRTKKP